MNAGVFITEQASSGTAVSLSLSLSLSRKHATYPPWTAARRGGVRAGLRSRDRFLRSSHPRLRRSHPEFRSYLQDQRSTYDELTEEMRRLIDLAEATHHANPVKLQLIGWGGMAQPSADLPGQPRALEACIQGPGTIFLDWKAPEAGTGGRVRFYRIERRAKNLGTGQITEEWGNWQRSATPSEYTATDQPRGAEIEYRVFAVNDNGDSTPRNTVMAVL